MRLGPSLIGAIVGAVVGVAAQIGLESTMDREATWFAVVIGLLTGLGARMMAGDGIRATSYVRAGLAAIIGLAAIVAGSYAASEVVRKKNVDAYESASRVMPSDAERASSEEQADAAPGDDEAAEGEDEVTDETESADEAAEDVDDSAEDATDEEGDATEDTADEGDDATETVAPGQPVDLAALEKARRGTPELPPPSPWQFAFFGIGTFLAYELARGGGKSEHAAASTEV